MHLMSCRLCILIRICLFFFFKQKTAYEMRISDWSSDVCSSDLTKDIARDALLPRFVGIILRLGFDRPIANIGRGDRHQRRMDGAAGARHHDATESADRQQHHKAAPQARDRGWAIGCSSAGFRSEEHTSELQSLMRISYAVFCLKKKKQTITN